MSQVPAVESIVVPEPVMQGPTLAAAKMSLTDCEISGPMPSPSINVTVYLPYISLLPRVLKVPISFAASAYVRAFCSLECRDFLICWHRVAPYLKLSVSWFHCDCSRWMYLTNGFRRISGYSVIAKALPQRKVEAAACHCQLPSRRSEHTIYDKDNLFIHRRLLNRCGDRM